MKHSEKVRIKKLHTFIFKTILLFFQIPLLITTTNLQASVNELWNYRPQAGFVDTSPAVGDLDDDGVKDLVFCTVAGRVLALNSLGLRMWYYDAKTAITTPPVIADVNNDGTLNVLAYTNNGLILCLNGMNGNLIWKYKMPHKINWGGTSLVVTDLQNEGSNEIIAADNGGNLICLNGKGQVIWHKKTKDKFNSAPAVGNLSPKGGKNILIGSDRSPLICFDSAGKELWRTNEKNSSLSSPLICDLNDDKINEILVGAGKYFTVFDNHGKKLWQYKMRGDIHDGISFADLDGDNKKEIITADLSGDLVALTSEGMLLWKQNLTQRVRRSATIADIDGDTKPEVLAAGYSSFLFVFGHDGSLKEQIPLKGGMNASPTIVDFNNDGRLSVVCGSGSGIIAFSWMDKKTYVDTPIPFAEYRCNSMRTGSVIKAGAIKKITRMEVDYGGLYVGDNVFSVNVYNPLKKKLTVELSVTKDGILSNKKISVLDTLFHGEIFYNLYGRKALNIEFTARVIEKGKTLLQKSYTCYLVPFAKDIYDLNETLASLKSIFLGKEKSRRFETERIIVFSQRLKDIEEKSSVAATMPMLELSKLKNNFLGLREDISVFEKMVKAAQDSKKKFAVYSANPWAPFGGVDEVVEVRVPQAKITVEAFKNEIESAALNVANFAGSPLTIRVEALSLIKVEDSTIVLPKNVYKFYEVLNVPTQALNYSADALPLMNQAQTIMVPNYDLRQLWINIDTKSLTPGLWKGEIKLRSLQVESQEINVPVSIKVWPTALPEKQVVHLCHWGYVHSSRLKNYPEKALSDQLDHGTNVFVATPDFAPVAKFNSNGRIVGEIDYSKHDEYVKKHIKNGLILFLGYQSGLKGPAKQLSPVWLKAHKIWLKAWLEHLGNMGVTYDQYAFYPVDEPGLNDVNVDRLIAYGKAIREADPQAHIYTDPVGGATMADLKNMSPYVDIWCPNRNGYLLNEGQDKLAYIKSTGKTVWTYECIGNAKHLSPLGYYRAQAWLIWHYGLTGMGFWSYCTSSADPWYVPEGTLDYLLIYQGEGVVSSKRWEAIRDGIEDYGILSQLRAAIEKANAKSLSKYVEEAKALLKTDAFEVARYCGLDEYGTEPGIGGMKAMRKAEDLRWKKIKMVRKEIARLLQELEK